jgi:cytochrome c oxidase cbb3-type subunit III
MKRFGRFITPRSVWFAVAGSLLLCIPACRRSSNSNSVAVNGQAITSNPVGPVPGGAQNINYPTDPYIHDPVALQDGRRLFNWYNCSGCHGGHAGGGMGPSLRDPVWKYGNRDDQIFDTIAHGRSMGMPSWGTKIPERQIWELVAYIKSMGTPEEPDPPVEPAHEEQPNPSQQEKPSVATQTSMAERH